MQQRTAFTGTGSHKRSIPDEHQEPTCSVTGPLGRSSSSSITAYKYPASLMLSQTGVLRQGTHCSWHRRAGISHLLLPAWAQVMQLFCPPSTSVLPNSTQRPASFAVPSTEVPESCPLTAALGSMSRCCSSRASCQRPCWHSCSSWHRGAPRMLARAQIPPEAPGGIEVHWQQAQHAASSHCPLPPCSALMAASHVPGEVAARTYGIARHQEAG